MWSWLEYALNIWSAASKRSYNRLKRLQKLFFKFALLLHIFSLQDRRTVVALMFVNNIVSNNIDITWPYQLKCVLGDLRMVAPFRILCRKANYN